MSDSSCEMSWGRDVGRLLQNNGYLSGLRTFALQSGGKDLGRTTFDDWQRVDGAFGENARRTVTILDVNDRVVAGITERRTTMQFVGNDFYDGTRTISSIRPTNRSEACASSWRWRSTSIAGPSREEC